jgi:hypothetical protein
MADTPNPKLRWYRLTPDRLVPGLLAVEALLLLSEWGGWFPFNRHKGWTVLTAVAAVGLTLLVFLLWLAAALLFRCRFQYSLRSLLLLVVAVAIPCSWFATEMQQATKQHEAVQAIETVGRAVRYDFETWDPFRDPFAAPVELPYPAWLRKLLGDDFCASIRFANLANTQITDAGLVHLQGLSQLQGLDLSGTKVTDAGLAHLQGLRKLEVLLLINTQVTDAGLMHLQGLSRLQEVDLRHTQVTDRGVKSLQEALPNCTILPPVT